MGSDYPGLRELRSQIPDAVVVGQCDCGCPTVDIEVLGGASQSNIQHSAPYEGRVTALSDEPVADIIVSLEGGFLRSLEYVSYTDQAAADWPSLDRIEVFQDHD